MTHEYDHLQDLTKDELFSQLKASYENAVKLSRAWSDMRERAEKAEAEVAALKADAERYRWLREEKCNSLHLTRDGDHACNYVTAKEWIEKFMPDDFADDPQDEIQRMKDTNTIWALQIYPNTPIGFNVYHAATLDAAIDAARKC